MARTNLHEAAELLTPSNELSNIMRRDQLLIDMPWKQGLLSIMELCFDPRARAGLADLEPRYDTARRHATVHSLQRYQILSKVIQEVKYNSTSTHYTKQS